MEEETRNGRRKANPNPNRNHDTINLGLFSFENLKDETRNGSVEDETRNGNAL